MFRPLLAVQIRFCVEGARDFAPCQKWAKREGLVATTTTTTLHSTSLHYIQLHYATLHYTDYPNYNYKYNYKYNCTTLRYALANFKSNDNRVFF